jgi:hypothetical protein
LAGCQEAPHSHVDALPRHEGKRTQAHDQALHQLRLQRLLKELCIVHMVKANMLLIGSLEAKLRALPKPASQCLRHEEVEEWRRTPACQTWAFDTWPLTEVYASVSLSSSWTHCSMGRPHPAASMMRDKKDRSTLS